MRVSRISLGVIVFGLLPWPALGQDGSRFNIVCGTQERISDNHLRCAGNVELEQGDVKIYADIVEYFVDERRAIAEGNVTFTQGANTISADRAEFNTETRLGTFYRASGIASMRPSRQRSGGGGIAPPQMTGIENDVYFFGDTVEKIGPKKYRITNGGFTTCVQPTPRWNLHASTVVLNIDHYTLLRQAVFRVKDVPLLYLPFLYYPTNGEDRATGFLIPTYGTSSIRGQNISNAFFWAISRSQDATFLHDWFSKTGQGAGSEYRYNFGSGNGDIRAYFLNDKETSYDRPDGSIAVQPARRSHEIRGGGNQQLPGGLIARGRVDYFSSIEAMQTLNTNVYENTRTQRSFGGNIVGSWRSYSLNATLDRREYFFNSTNSTLSGNGPRIAVSRSEVPVFPNSELYFSADGEYAAIVRESRTGDATFDSSLTRIDAAPEIRYPFKRWQWFTVNSSLAWRGTYYTRSLDPDTIDPATSRAAIVENDINRSYATMRVRTVGPVFNRVWDTPDNGYAERFKHSIQPFLDLQRTTGIDNFDQIIKTDGEDGTVGSATSYRYGIVNRIYARRRIGQRTQAVEIASIEVRQSYYTDQRSAQYDLDYSTSYGQSAPSNFSPISITARATPSSNVDASLRAEVDSQTRALRTFSVTGGYDWDRRIESTVGWSRRFLIEGLPGFDSPGSLDHSLNVRTNVRTVDNRYGAAYSFNYDVLRSKLIQQRMTGFYNVQCCGIAFEYQSYNLRATSFGVPVDRRFFVSFTLAGLGNFSPFSGALGGVPR